MASTHQIVMTSVRLRRELHEQLRGIAFKNKRSLHSLLIEGARDVAMKNQSTPENRPEPVARQLEARDGPPTRVEKD